ncbi:uncharacterized protein LOC119162970 [Rhipicephalus microplus]|uniref:uncharacterized protein LOC119162970 n=1 Tax=Rhipicephalus microplus TaxID=6941 RepID=UPI003F6A9035
MQVTRVARSTSHLLPLLPHPVQQGDRVPDSASTESSFDSPQLMQGGAEGLLLLAQIAATSHEGLEASLSTPESPEQVAATSHEGLQASLYTPEWPDLAAGLHEQSTLQEEAMGIEPESANPISLPDPAPSNLSASHFNVSAFVQPPMDIGEKSEAQASIATPGPSGHAAGIQWEPVHEQELPRPQDMLATFATPRRRKQAKVDTPEKAFLRARTARLASEQQRSRKAIKKLQQFKRRLKKQNAELKSVLKTLTKENILLREQVSVLDTLGAANQHLLKRQIAKQTGQHLKKYSPELRTFALTLNFFTLLEHINM